MKILKRIIAVIILFFGVQFSSAQQYLPGYPEVVKTFCTLYIVDNNDPANVVNFAKRKDGWYVQHINQLQSDSVLSEEPFWQVSKQAFVSVKEAPREEKNQDEINTVVKGYLASNSNNNWFGYERCRYFGYTGWEHDLIRDYENEPVLQDTLLESLAKAYSSITNAYLWHQTGGRWFKQDTLLRRLQRLELPSQLRLQKVEEYFNKAIAIYSRLEKQNPDYTTLVGNISVKKFNECLFGYTQMSLAQQQKKADEYIQKAELEEHYILQAKNYLNACSKNGILFTYGDNDTYQLWYVQQKENFRKDVLVINTSLLGLPIYIDMLKKNKEVSFSAPASYYGKKIADYSYFKEPKNTDVKSGISLKNLLQDILLQKDSTLYTGPDGEPQLLGAYNNKKINLAVNSNLFNTFSTFKTTAKSINFSLNNYLLMNDFMLLDIIYNNINIRPIYFTSINTGFFDSNLVQQGIVFQLYPTGKKDRKQIEQQEISGLEKFTSSIYNPIISFDANRAKNISIEGNYVFFQLYSKIIDYYKESKLTEKAKYWLNKATTLYPLISEINMPGAYSFLNSTMDINKEKMKEYGEIYISYLHKKYAHPASIDGYLSREDYKEYLDYFKRIFTVQNVHSTMLDSLIKEMAD
jgi:hypothetical protein